MIRRVALAMVCTLLAGCAPRAGTDRFTDVYRALHPATALLRMKIPADDPKRKGKLDDAFGTGVVVESGAWGSRVLTDAHVVEDARDLRVEIGDDGHRSAAHVVATTGPNDERDVAILETALPNRPVAHLGTAAGLEPGRPIGVLGYPIPDAFNDEKLGTTVSLYGGRVASIRKGALELDVAIIPGESGGPVFDALSGDVVGIASSRFEEERAIGFATPIDVAIAFLREHPRR